MNNFYLEGPGGIPGVKQVPSGSSVHTNKPFLFHGGYGGQRSVVDVTANKTLVADDSGSVVLLDVASGATVTLPADSAGLEFYFVVKTTVTTNSYKVITAAATSYLQGSLDVPVAAGTAALFFGNGTSDISVNLNGTTTGGLLGGSFRMTCLASGLWQVEGTVEGSGTVATPFATT